MDCGLDESADVLPPGESTPKAKDKGHTFNKFLKAVATSMVKGSAGDDDMKQTKKVKVRECMDQLRKHEKQC